VLHPSGVTVLDFGRHLNAWFISAPNLFEHADLYGVATSLSRARPSRFLFMSTQRGPGYFCVTTHSGPDSAILWIASLDTPLCSADTYSCPSRFTRQRKSAYGSYLGICRSPPGIHASGWKKREEVGNRARANVSRPKSSYQPPVYAPSTTLSRSPHC